MSAVRATTAPLLSLLAVLAGAMPALAADEVDPASLYEVSTEGSTTRLKAGEAGRFVLSIRSKPGAHVSDEAPLKLELKGTQVTPQKERLTLKDSVAPKPAGQQYVDPRFEVPLNAAVAGKGAVDAKLTFFICTDKLCARQQKALSVPVEVF
jgi:hypothetical protein